MSLSSFIRNGGLRKVATATSATLATQEPEKGSTVAKAATVAVANPMERKNIDSVSSAGEEESPWAAHRYGLLNDAYERLDHEFRRSFPQGAPGIVRWVKKSCPDLASKIAALENKIDLECLSEVVSLAQYKKHLQVWVEAYLEGFRKFLKRDEFPGREV